MFPSFGGLDAKVLLLVITDRQRRILEFVTRTMDEDGHAPSVRVIGEAVGLSSPASVHAQLKVLEEAGYLRRDPTNPRRMEVDLTGGGRTSVHGRPGMRATGDRSSQADRVHGGLTARQRRILDVIHDAVTRDGYPPSIREIREQVGLASTSTVSAELKALEDEGHLRRGSTKPRAIELLPKKARFAIPKASPTYVPVFGRIAANGPIPDLEHIEEYLPLPRSLVGEGELFMLKVRGDSMIDAGLLDGDYVVVRSQHEAGNGDIVVALLGNQGTEGEVTVKYLFREDGRALLLPAHPKYDPIDAGHAKILGRVVTVVRRM